MQLAALAPSSPNKVMVSASHAQPTAAPAQEHPPFAPVEPVTTAQIPILRTLLAPVSMNFSDLEMGCLKIKNTVGLIRTNSLFLSNIC